MYTHRGNVDIGKCTHTSNGCRHWKMFTYQMNIDIEECTHTTKCVHRRMETYQMNVHTRNCAHTLKTHMCGPKNDSKVQIYIIKN